MVLQTCRSASSLDQEDHVGPQQESAFSDVTLGTSTVSLSRSQVHTAAGTACVFPTKRHVGHDMAKL